MNEKLKIGYLVPQFPGQTHIFFWRELLEMEKLGAQVQVFSTRMPPSGLISHSWSDQAIARTRYLGRPRLGDLIGSIAALPYRELLAELRRHGLEMLKDILICAPAARRLLRECRALGIEHVHIHSCGRGALIGALANRMGGLRYSITLHGPLQDYGIGQRIKWRHAAFATIITEKLLAEMQAELGADLPDRLVVQPMGVDIEALARVEPYQPVGAGQVLRLFSCGRLNIVKGHQDLMQAVAILIARGIDVQLEIAGEDDAGGQGYRQELSAHLLDLNLQDHVTLLGAIDADKVRDKLQGAHIFALASWSEPLGVAYMEAMACGVPTIGTNAGGVPELIEDGVDGCLVPPQNPEALADMIEAIANDPDYAVTLGQKGRDRIVSGFRSTLGAEVLLREIASYKSGTA